jgi:DNA-binding NtrC family response regulator
MSDISDFERMAEEGQETSERFTGTVFVVDDEPEIVEILSDLICSLGYHVVGFTEPAPLLQAFRAGTPDLVVTDHRMPGMTGSELLREIRKIDPAIPVVMISGFLDRQDFIQVISEGVFAIIDKPFSSERVLKVCRNAVDFSQAQKVMNRSLNLLLFHCDDIRTFLDSQGRSDLGQTLQQEIRQMVEQRRKIQGIERG